MNKRFPLVRALVIKEAEELGRIYRDSLPDLDSMSDEGAWRRVLHRLALRAHKDSPEGICRLAPETAGWQICSGKSQPSEAEMEVFILAGGGYIDGARPRRRKAGPAWLEPTKLPSSDAFERNLIDLRSRSYDHDIGALLLFLEGRRKRPDLPRPLLRPRSREI